MQGYQRIIVAVDFSPHSQDALQRALQLTSHHDGCVTVVNVVDYTWSSDTDYVVPPSDDTEVQLVKAANARLDAMLLSAGEPVVERIIVVGRPKQEILRLAEQERADLIVMGARGRHGLLGLLGSTTEQVMRRAPCDVLVVNGAMQEATETS